MRPNLAGEPTGFGLPSSNCLVGPDAGQGPNSLEIVPELAPRPEELVVAGHTYVISGQQINGYRSETGQGHGTREPFFC